MAEATYDVGVIGAGPTSEHGTRASCPTTSELGLRLLEAYGP